MTITHLTGDETRTRTHTAITSITLQLTPPSEIHKVRISVHLWVMLCIGTSLTSIKSVL